MNKHLWVYSGLFVSFFVLFLIFGKPQTLTSVPDVVPQSALSASDSELADSEPEEIPSLALHCTNVNSIFGLSPNMDWKKIWEENADY